MKAVAFEGCNSIFGKDQPQYNELPAMITYDQTARVTVCFELSPEELEKINQTGRIYISQLRFGKIEDIVNEEGEKEAVFTPNRLQPLSVTVFPEDIIQSNNQ